MPYKQEPSGENIIDERTRETIAIGASVALSLPALPGPGTGLFLVASNKTSSHAAKAIIMIVEGDDR
jgi:hypothetical protein